jgi:hypothetical protein
MTFAAAPPLENEVSKEIMALAVALLQTMRLVYWGYSVLVLAAVVLQNEVEKAATLEATIYSQICFR